MLLQRSRTAGVNKFIDSFRLHPLPRASQPLLLPLQPLPAHREREVSGVCEMRANATLSPRASTARLRSLARSLARWSGCLVAGAAEGTTEMAPRCTPRCTGCGAIRGSRTARKRAVMVIFALRKRTKAKPIRTPIATVAH